MKFLVINASFEASNVLEQILDEDVFKNDGIGSKYKKPKLEYYNVLIPLQSIPENYYENYQLIEGSLVHYSGVSFNNDTLYTLWEKFKPVIIKSKEMSIDVLRVIDDSEIGISYTDGSFSNSSKKASYACYTLLNEDINGTYDDFTGKTFVSKDFSGVIDEGTNNIGELTAIKIAAENFNEKPYQIIISDSIYGIKTYREYIHVWKNNGFKTYAGKPIKNKELIVDTEEILKEHYKQKIVFFKWTKGHAKNSFNDLCDQLAKKELGI